MRAEIRKNHLTAEKATDERCFIREISNNADDESVSIAEARVEPGVTTAWHKLAGISERYIIVSGQGRVELARLKPADVTAGDVVRIPPDTAQRITNTGQNDLIFYAVCSPRFLPEYYITLE